MCFRDACTWFATGDCSMSEIGPATRRDLEKRLRPGRSGRIPTVRLNLDVTVAPELTRQLEEHARKLIREANDEREAAIRAEMERLGLTEEEVVRDRSWAAQWDVSTGAFRGLVRLPDVPESEEDDAVDGLRYAVDFISKAQRAGDQECSSSSSRA